MKPLVSIFAFAALAFADPSPDKSVGSRTAPTLIDVFLDFQCPPCKMFHDQTLPDVISNYADKGKVFIVYHDLPLPMHNHALEAARWANAANSVHKYKEVSNKLFETQTQWAATGDIRAVVASVLSPADLKTTEAHLKDPAIEAGIDKDRQLAVQAQVKQTPTIVVTHKLQNYPFGGFVSYSILKQALDDIAKK
jgi:protein-disulfide isomerase